MAQRYIGLSMRCHSRLACVVFPTITDLHDMRHAFATNTLVHWYQSKQDPARCLPILSAYLGHVHVADTRWYLTGSPELMREAMRRLERRWGEPAMTTAATAAPLLERFFTQRLMQQRQAALTTISSYRDTFRQFLKFAQLRCISYLHD